MTDTSKQLSDRRPLDNRRVKARLIDWLVLSVPSVFVITMGLDTPLTLLVLVALEVIYFFLCEATTGYTLGKYLMGLRVIKPDGSAPGGNSIAARNVIRIVEEPFLALIVMFASGGRRQRIGDFVGTTAVGSVVYSNRPRPSKARVIYPVLWLAGAVLLGLVLNASTGYLRDVNNICFQETGRLKVTANGQFDLFEDVYGDMERRVAALDPPPGEQERHREILALMHTVSEASADLSRQMKPNPKDVHEFRAAYARFREVLVPAGDRLATIGVTCERSG